MFRNFSNNRARIGPAFKARSSFATRQGVNDALVRGEMEALFAEVDQLRGVDVASPYVAGNEGQITDNGRIAFAELQVSDRDYQAAIDLGNRIERLGEAHELGGLTVEYGGEMFADFEMPESEALGLLAAAIILLIAFGSVIAMGLPIGTALFGLGTGVALTVLLSHVQSMPDFAPQLTAMIGLGVGIDYALFIVTRYRDGLHAGLDNERALVRAVDTSGRAVLFAGATVIISLLGLYIMGLAFVSRPRHRRRARCRDDDDRGGDAASGAHRLRRKPDRGHAIPRSPRFRERGLGAAARRAVRPGDVRAARPRRAVS